MDIKQPELGKKISEMRKAKGLTQEELVELCNLNVRTIQRIEAGEVTPRSYTIKALFEALGIEWKEEKESFARSSRVPLISSRLKDALSISFGAGVLYLLFSMIEIPLDMAMMEGTVQGYIYIPIKITVFTLYTVYMVAFLKINIYSELTNIMGAFWLLLVARFIAYAISFWVVLDSGLEYEFYFVFPSMILWGLGYILLGYSLTKFKDVRKFALLPIGILGIVSGALMLTIIGGPLAVFTQFVFEIGLLYFLFNYYRSIGDPDKPEPQPRFF